MLNEFRDLERKHQIVKEQYEAEIMRLKGQAPANGATPSAPVGVQGQALSSALPSSQLTQNSAMNATKRTLPGVPDASSQLPGYADQASLPGMFPSRSISHHQNTPQGPNQPNPSSQIGPLAQLNQSDQQQTQNNNRPTQTGPPGQSNTTSQNPVTQQTGNPRLSTIPSLSPSGVNSGSTPTMPTMHSMGPGVMSRGPGAGLSGKMSFMTPNGNSHARDSNTIGHAIKKDTNMPIGQSIGGTGMTGPGSTNTFGPSVASRSGGMGPNPPSSTPGQGQDEGDWLVYQGRSTNGSVVNMNLELQNSLTLDSVVCCVRYSWDGNFLATGSNHSAHIFDSSTGQNVATFSKDSPTNRDDGNGTDSYVRAVCFSPDGKWLITGAEDHVVKVWDVRNRKVKHRLEGHGTDIYSVDASANGQFIISGSGDKKAKLWKLETGELLRTLGGEYGPTDGITSVSVSPTSQHVAAGSLDKIVRVWDVESGRLVRQFGGHRDSVYSVAFSPDGRMLLSGSLDKTLKLWDLSIHQSNQPRLSFNGHKDFVLSVAFCPRGKWLISGSKDRTVQFWDPRQPTFCLMLQGHKNSVISIAHNPTAKALATGSGDCRARTWLYS